MDADDLEPQTKRADPFVRTKVETLSVAELHGYIAHLESEIGRAQAEIANKGVIARRCRVAVQLRARGQENGA